MARFRIATSILGLSLFCSSCQTEEQINFAPTELHRPIEIAASGRSGKVALFQLTQNGIQKSGEFRKAGDFIGLAKSDHAKVLSAGESIHVWDGQEFSIAWNGLDFRPVSIGGENYFFSSMAQSTDKGWRTNVVQFNSQGKLELTSVPGRLDNVVTCEDENFGVVSEIVVGDTPEPMHFSKLALGEESEIGVRIDLPDGIAWSALPGIATCSTTRDGEAIVKQVFQSRPYDGSKPKLMLIELDARDGSQISQRLIEEDNNGRSTRVLRSNGFAQAESDGTVVTVDQDAVRRYDLNVGSMEEVWSPSTTTAPGAYAIQAFDIEDGITAIATMNVHQNEEILFINNKSGMEVSRNLVTLSKDTPFIEAIAL